jgi:hypothetical protein
MNKPKPKFKDFKKSLPENLANTPNRKYNMRRNWKESGKPKDFNESIKGEEPMFNKVYHPEEGKSYYHGGSVGPKSGKFLKPKRHISTYKELEGFKSVPKEERSGTKLVSRGRTWKYKEKTAREMKRPGVDKRSEKRIDRGIAMSKKAEAKYNAKQQAKQQPKLNLSKPSKRK